MMRSSKNNDNGSRFPLGLKSIPEVPSTIGTTSTNTNVATTSEMGIINPVFVEHHLSSVESKDIDHVIVDEEEEEEFPPPPKPLSTATLIKASNRNKNKVETIDRTDSASFISNDSSSTIVTNASISSTGKLLIQQQSNNCSDYNSSNRNCSDCLQFHQNRHRILVNNQDLHHPKRQIYLPGGSSTTLPYAPYPPQWYYLLAADSPKFRKHRHTHYRKDCRQCREIVRHTFEQYYLRSGQSIESNNNKIPKVVTSMPIVSTDTTVTPTTPVDEATDSIGSISLDPNQLQAPQLHLRSTQQPYTLMAGSGTPVASTSSPSSLIANSYSGLKSKASCGHSCLKFSILFYCCIAIIMSISFICYLTRMFGLMSEDPLGPWTPMQYEPSHTSPINNNYSLDAITNNNDSTTTINSQQINGINNSFIELNWMNDSDFNSRQYISSINNYNNNRSLLERIRNEIIGLLISFAIMLIFILGLIAAILESMLCLRIFGAILSYLFLLTFGSALYIVILMVIANVSLKLVLSTISCAAVAITIHGLLAIAPFALADLISQERDDELIEAANYTTYFKYPSVKFLPLMPPPPLPSTQATKANNNYFGLGSFVRSWPSRPAFLPSTQFISSDTPIESIPNSEEWIQRNHTPTMNQQQQHQDQQDGLILDNISSEGLIPGSLHQEQQSTELAENGSNLKINNNKTNTQTVRFSDNWM